MIAGDMKAFLCRKFSQLDIMIIVEVILKLNKNEAQYVFKVTDTYGNVGLYDAQRLCEATEENTNSPHGFIIENRDMRQVTQIPDWVTKTVWYQIQIDRFA